MKMVIWSAAMLAAAAGTALGAKGDGREGAFPLVTSSVDGNGTDRAGTIVAIPINNMQSFSSFGDAANSVVNVNLPAGAIVNGIGWDVSFTAIGFSWQSELTLLVTDSAVSGGVAIGFSTTDAPGSGTDALLPVIKLADAGIPDFVLTDGILRLETYDTYDDGGPGVQDSFLNGTLYVQYQIPSPAGASLLGLAGIAALGRKRRA